MKAARNRLQRVADVFHAMPLAHDAVRDAYNHFAATGELPEHVGLASAVTRRCRLGIGDVDESDRAKVIRHVVERGDAQRDEVLHRIYREAVHGDEVVRMAARVVLRTLRKLGHDVTRRVFDGVTLDDTMECASGVGVWLLGFPDRLETLHATIGE